ncbi:MAG: IS1182 family transposase [Actinomycetota bacterium]|nr:IS1182 family transposase [Actinomycetota bacterium]
MQGESDPQGEFLDVNSVVGHLLVKGSVFAFLAEHRSQLFPPSLFADMFTPGRGRPSIPAETMASVIVLQTLHGLSDREAADAVTFDLRWKAACGFPLGGTGFHPTTLTYWRRRLAASERPHRIFEAVREVIVSTGVLAGKHRRAMDSTILDDAVARQDTVTQLIASIRRVARDVVGGEQVVAERATRLAEVTGHDYSHTGKPRIAWDDDTAQQELVSALVGDAVAVLEGLDRDAIATKPDNETEHQAVALLALVAGQDVEPAEGSDGTDGRWRIARKTAPDRVISTVDPDARHAHKTQARRQDGFKAHIVNEPDTGLVTETELTKASGTENSDATVGMRLLESDQTVDETSDELEALGDSAYGTGEMLAALAPTKWTAVIKPWYQGATIADGFVLDDFTYDSATNSLTCPNNQTRAISPSGRVTFGKRCQDCPLRARCTTSTSGRTVTLGEHHQLQRQHRQHFADTSIQDTYRQHRPMVERSIAWLTRGNRRVPYRGIEKNNAWLHTRVAGLNLGRLITLGLTSTNGTWTLAPA